MAKLPRPTGKEMLRFLRQQGFVVVRVRGSHHVMRHSRHHTTVPVHRSEVLKIGTLRSILRDIELSPEKFTRLWQAHK